MKNLEPSVFVAIVAEPPWNDVGAAANELIRANWRRIDELRWWNDRFAVVAGESVVAIVINGTSAPCTRVAFRLFRCPDFTGIVTDSESLMRCAGVPCTRAGNRRALIEPTFGWRVQISRLGRAVARVAIIAATRRASVIGTRTVRISVLAQGAARVNAAWTCAVARVTRQVQIAWLKIVATALVRVTFWIRIVAFCGEIIETFLDVGCAAIAFVVWASVEGKKFEISAQFDQFYSTLPAHRRFKTWRRRWNICEASVVVCRPFPVAVSLVVVAIRRDWSFYCPLRLFNPKLRQQSKLRFGEEKNEIETLKFVKKILSSKKLQGTFRFDREIEK